MCALSDVETNKKGNKPSVRSFSTPCPSSERGPASIEAKSMLQAFDSSLKDHTLASFVKNEISVASESQRTTSVKDFLKQERVKERVGVFSYR